jgi:hypothetical protein
MIDMKPQFVVELPIHLPTAEKGAKTKPEVVKHGDRPRR